MIWPEISSTLKKEIPNIVCLEKFMKCRLKTKIKSSEKIAWSSVLEWPILSGLNKNVKSNLGKSIEMTHFSSSSPAERVRYLSLPTWVQKLSIAFIFEWPFSQRRFNLNFKKPCLGKLAIIFFNYIFILYYIFSLESNWLRNLLYAEELTQACLNGQILHFWLFLHEIWT